MPAAHTQQAPLGALTATGAERGGCSGSSMARPSLLLHGQSITTDFHGYPRWRWWKGRRWQSQLHSQGNHHHPGPQHPQPPRTQQCCRDTGSPKPHGSTRSADPLPWYFAWGMITLPAARVPGTGAGSIAPDSSTVLQYQLERHRGLENKSEPHGNSYKSSDHSSSITLRHPVTKSHSKWPQALLLPSWRDLQVPHKLTHKHQLGKSDKCCAITVAIRPTGCAPSWAQDAKPGAPVLLLAAELQALTTPAPSPHLGGPPQNATPGNGMDGPRTDAKETLHI